MQRTFQPRECKSAGVKLLAWRQLSFVSTFKDRVLSSAIRLVRQAVESKPVVLTIAGDVWERFCGPLWPVTQQDVTNSFLEVLLGYIYTFKSAFQASLELIVYVAQASPEPKVSSCWYYRQKPPHLALFSYCFRESLFACLFVHIFIIYLETGSLYVALFVLTPVTHNSLASKRFTCLYFPDYWD